MLSLALTLSLGGLVAETPRSATLLAPEERVTLQARLDELNLTPAPSLALPIGLLVGAVVAIGVAATFFAGAVLTSIFGGVFFPFLVPGLVAAVIGGALGTAGGFLLASVLRERRARSVELRDLKKKLEEAPQPNELPAPPSVEGPRPTLLLATF